ncbi:MAG TPA: YdeI/OmpD-associated family protein [Stellaceae bacterium]|nr:YdeI/OmpD-associated family protein [Stellaceae bacterium]
MNPQLDAYFSEATKWHGELNRLRMIVLGCGLNEDMKWRQPCYTFNGGIVLLISPFMDYCALAFFKGSLLKDPNGLLVAPGANSQSMRQMRFTNVQDIVERQSIIQSYIGEAIAVQKAGLKVEKKTAAASVPEEFQKKLDEAPALKTAFEALTPGRRRMYLIHFAQPKQSATRQARIDKCTPQILAGHGLDHVSRSKR